MIKSCPYLKRKRETKKTSIRASSRLDYYRIIRKLNETNSKRKEEKLPFLLKPAKRQQTKSEQRQTQKQKLHSKPLGRVLLQAIAQLFRASLGGGNSISLQSTLLNVSCFTISKNGTTTQPGKTKQQSSKLTLPSPVVVCRPWGKYCLFVSYFATKHTRSCFAVDSKRYWLQTVLFVSKKALQFMLQQKKKMVNCDKRKLALPRTTRRSHRILRTKLGKLVVLRQAPYSLCDKYRTI